MSATAPQHHTPQRCCRFTTSHGPTTLSFPLATSRATSLAAWLAASLAASLLIGLASSFPSVRADTIEDFEGPDTSWSLAESDCQAEVVAHQRRLQGARSGQGCEFLQIRHGQGSAIHITHPIDPSPIIAEWSPTVWVKSDAPGVQLMARVVLPRTRDPQTGRPLTTLLHGDSYRRATLWQLLTIDQPVLRLERQIRALRSQWGPELDARQAYVDLLVLNVYSGGGVARIAIDDLEVRGHVEQPMVGYPGTETRSAMALATGVTGTIPSTPANLKRVSPASSKLATLASVATPDVRLQGGLLTVRDRPMLPRAALWRGEPFDWLADLGFNSLVLAEFPTNEQIAEARRLSLWLIAPPPSLPPLPGSPPGSLPGSLPGSPPGSLPGSTSSAVVWIGDASAFPPCDRILAWNLGAELPPSRDRALRRAADANRLPRELRRPLWGCANESLSTWSRLADLLATNAWRASASTPAMEESFAPATATAYGLAPINIARVDIAPISLDTVLPGRPVWADLHLPGLHAESHTGLEKRSADPRYDDQALTEIRGTLYRAVSDGVRGVLLRAPDTLEPGRPELRPLLSTLRTLNAELALLEPWLSASSGIDEAVCREEGYQVRVLHNERARLAIVLAPPRRAAGVAGGAVGGDAATDGAALPRVARAFGRSTKPDSQVSTHTPLSFIDPGATNGMEAYAITPSGLRPVSRRRVAGGVEVTLENMPSFALVALTQEPLVVNYLTRRLASGRGSPTFQERLSQAAR